MSRRAVALLEGEQDDQAGDSRSGQDLAPCRAPPASVPFGGNPQVLAHHEREENGESRDQHQFEHGVRGTRANRERAIPHVERGAPEDEERRRAALHHRAQRRVAHGAVLGIPGDDERFVSAVQAEGYALEGERHHREQQQKRHAARVGRLGNESEPDCVQLDEDERRGGDSHDDDARDAQCTGPARIDEEHGDAHEHEGRNHDCRGRVRDDDARPRADGEEVRVVEGVEREDSPRKRR